MSGCEQVREDLAAWVDGALRGEAAEAVAAHVSACPACRAEAEGLRATDRALLAALGDDLLPRPGWLAGVEARILEQEGAGAAAPARPNLTVHPGGAWRVAALRVAAAVLAALALGVGVATWRAPREVADQAVPSQRPAPRPERPEELPGQPTPDPDALLVAEVLDAAAQEQLPLEELLAPRPVEATGPGPLEGLQPGDQELLEDLELLAYLAEGEELDVSESLELLEQLAPEELDEG